MPKPTAEQVAEFNSYLGAIEEAKERGEVVPVSETAQEQFQRGMREGEKGGYTVCKDEPKKTTLVAGYPEGELYETDMSEEELAQAIAELTESRDIFIKYLIAEKPFKGFDKPRNTNLFDIKDSLSEFPIEIRDAMSLMADHNIDNKTVLFDLPQVLQEVIEKYSRSLGRLKKKSVK